MKVFEILQQCPPVSEENLINSLKGFDWKYEFSDDNRRQQRGHKAMNILENMVFQFWKTDPNRAIELWNSYSPYGKDGVTPSFIIRLESQDV